MQVKIGIRGKKIQTTCKCCGNVFTVREADRKRGWGIYCSKSCKAKSNNPNVQDDRFNATEDMVENFKRMMEDV
jgi:hypothetical protein